MQRNAMIGFSRWVICGALAAALAGTAPGQAIDSRPSFEAASVRLSPPPETGRDVGMRVTLTPGQLNYLNVPLGVVIQEAYGVTWQLEPNTGPASIWSERYDIVAKLLPETPKDQVRLMWQALLEERFKLVVHWEKRQRSMNALVVGKRGLKIAPEPFDPEKKEAIKAKSIPGGLRMTFEHVPMERLAKQLSQDGPGFNATGLDGCFSFTLDYSNETLKAAAPTAGGGAASEEQRVTLPPLRQVLKDKTGLEFEKRVVPVDMLIVDHAERVPTGN